MGDRLGTPRAVAFTFCFLQRLFYFISVCGCMLVAGGILVIFDPERILLSKLISNGAMTSWSQPLFYYVSLGVAVLGLILTGIGVLGCWASCAHSYYLLTMYFLIILVLLVGECAMYVVAWLWPHCLGLGIDPTDLAKTMKGNYGTIGEEQFTAAFDLAQTMFHCCGVDSADEYDTSMWRLQFLGPSKAAVPLSCCILDNESNKKAYLSPVPVNLTLCQTLEVNRHQGYRHTKGCLDSLETWYRHHYVIFLSVGLAVVLVEFLVLLSSILSCAKIYQYKHEAKNQSEPLEEQKTDRLTENPYHRRSPMPAYSNEAYALPEGAFRQNYTYMDSA